MVKALSGGTSSSHRKRTYSEFWIFGFVERIPNKHGRLRDWAVDHVASHVAREAHSVTKSKLLQTRDVVLDHDFIKSFSFSALNERLKDSTPIAMRMLEAFATSRCAEMEHSEWRKERTMMVRTAFCLRFNDLIMAFRLQHWLHSPALESIAIVIIFPSAWSAYIYMRLVLNSKQSQFCRHWVLVKAIPILSPRISAAVKSPKPLRMLPYLKSQSW